MKDNDDKRQDTNMVGLTITPGICLESFYVSVQRGGNQLTGGRREPDTVNYLEPSDDPGGVALTSLRPSDD